MKNTLLFLLFAPFFCLGQKQANVWYFGDKAGADFNFNPQQALLNGQTDFLLPIGWNEAYSSISDSAGALLFYSNGVSVWNKQQALMPNGTGLSGHRSSSMGCLIVPQPGSEQYFYVFTNDAVENNFQNGLRYSIVDMCMDGGNGAVISTSKNTLIYSLASERLVAVKHANGSDYWIVSHKYNSDEFCAFQLTSAGITSSITSNCGPIDGVGGAEMAISNNGQKIAYCISTGVSTVVTSFMADFNASTGVVSNAQILSNGGREYAASFSPDNTKLYFSTTGFGNIFQYNLNAGNLSAIIASKSYLFQNGPDQWRHMAHGPDGKIYVSRAGKQYLSVINNPNGLYPACSYVDSAIYLGGRYTSHGLPNFVADFQYSNTVPTRACGLATGILPASEKLRNGIYPNPSRGIFRFYGGDELQSGQLVLINLLGQKVFEQSVTVGMNDIQTTDLPVGLYTYILFENNQAIKSGKLAIE